MSAPSGKAIFLRDPDGFARHGGPAAYARGLGCSWVAAFGRVTSDSQLIAMKRAGLRVYLYEHPGAPWRPAVFLGQLAAEADRAHRLGLAGVLPDPEDGWSGAQAMAQRCAEAIRNVKASGLDVGVTSYPYFPQRETFRRSGAWGCPQVYANPTRGEYDRYIPGFVDLWRGWDGVCPAISLGWKKDPHPVPMGAAEQRSYQNAVPRTGSGIIWYAGLPAPSNPVYQVGAEWDVGATAGFMIGIVLAALAALTVVTLLLTGVIK